MNNRERISLILNGSKPDRMPFMVFSELMPRGCFEREMRNRGMGLITHCTSLWSEMPNVAKTEKMSGGEWTVIYQTPAGDVFETYKTHVGRITGGEGVRSGFLIRDVRDYEAVISMIDDTTYHMDADMFEHIERELGDDGITHTWTDEPPYMDAQYFLGLEKWSYDQVDHPEEFSRLLDALERRQERRLKMLLDCPERYLINLGNLAGNFGPEQYERYVLPYYKKYVPLFREKGKVCTIHADALNLNEFKDLVKETGIKVVEAFTPPPVGNLSLADARKAWGKETTIWINFPETVFYDGYEATKQYMVGLLKSDPCCNKFIGFTEMGLLGADQENARMFEDGTRAIMDAIDEAGIY